MSRLNSDEFFNHNGKRIGEFGVFSVPRNSNSLFSSVLQCVSDTYQAKSDEDKKKESESLRTYLSEAIFKESHVFKNKDQAISYLEAINGGPGSDKIVSRLYPEDTGSKKENTKMNLFYRMCAERNFFANTSGSKITRKGLNDIVNDLDRYIEWTYGNYQYDDEEIDDIIDYLNDNLSIKKKVYEVLVDMIDFDPRVQIVSSVGEKPLSSYYFMCDGGYYAYSVINLENKGNDDYLDGNKIVNTLQNKNKPLSFVFVDLLAQIMDINIVLLTPDEISRFSPSSSNHRSFVFLKVDDSGEYYEPLALKMGSVYIYMLDHADSFIEKFKKIYVSDRSLPRNTNASEVLTLIGETPETRGRQRGFQKYDTENSMQSQPSEAGPSGSRSTERVPVKEPSPKRAPEVDQSKLPLCERLRLRRRQGIPR